MGTRARLGVKLQGEGRRCPITCNVRWLRIRPSSTTASLVPILDLPCNSISMWSMCVLMTLSETLTLLQPWLVHVVPAFWHKNVVDTTYLSFRRSAWMKCLIRAPRRLLHLVCQGLSGRL